MYVEAGRKRHPVTHQFLESDSNDSSDTNRSMYVTPVEVREAIQKLDDKDYDELHEEELNEEQREVMEDIWLKADEMGEQSNYKTDFSYFLIDK